MNEEFRRVGYGRCCKYFQWMKKVEALRGNDIGEFLRSVGILPGELVALGTEYYQGRGNQATAKIWEASVEAVLNPRPAEPPIDAESDEPDRVLGMWVVHFARTLRGERHDPDHGREAPVRRQVPGRIEPRNRTRRDTSEGGRATEVPRRRGLAMGPKRPSGDYERRKSRLLRRTRIHPNGGAALIHRSAASVWAAMSSTPGPDRPRLAKWSVVLDARRAEHPRCGRRTPRPARPARRGPSSTG